MKLWIRSQDKTELVKVEGIKYEKVPVGHSILVPYEFGVYNVGQYETKERALEVLDEIQNILILKKLSELNGKDFTKGMTSTEELRMVVNTITVFEMPQR